MVDTKVVPQSTFVVIGAEMAKEFLSKERPPQAGVRNTNRKISDRLVQEYAEAMLRGEWELTHQGIAFSTEDTLVDGGHRLRAVVLADAEKPGIKVPFMVTTGVSPEAMLTMDIGRRRVPSDFLAMSGEINVTSLSGILRMAYCYYNVPWSHTETWARFRITPTMQIEYLEQNPLLREAVYESFPLKRLFKSSALGAFWYIAKTERPDIDVQDFLDQLRTGEMMTKGDPALTLRELMLNARAGRESFSAPQELALLIKAFNRWIKGEDSFLLAFRINEAFPRITQFGK